MFKVLYDFLLYVAIPIAFEMSYVKVFQKSMKAYHINDMTAMSRLLVYLAIQWFLGVLVRKGFVRVALKRITLALLILLQLKEAFFEEVLFDMTISMFMESGLVLLLFFKYSNLLIILQVKNLEWIVVDTLIEVRNTIKRICEQVKEVIYTTQKRMQMSEYRIHHYMIQYSWYRAYC
jgi:hypothetical protein